MITPKVTGAIITGLVIVLGIALLYPALRIENQSPGIDKAKNIALMTINIVNSSNLPTWCDELSNLLKINSIDASIFITGMLAEKYPSCITNFIDSNDIGSMSYSYDKITSTNSYPAQLDNIAKGKKAIDVTGGLNSTLFRAPYGSVDENIYSLLTRSHILVDFSYDDHYNIYTDGLSGKTFYKFPLKTLTSYTELEKFDPEIPLMVSFYNYDSVRSIENFINMTSNSFKFDTASELTNLDLTKIINSSMS